MPKYYPININLENANCLVVGGGGVAERKVCTLLCFGARVTIVSPKITPGLRELAQKGRIILKERHYKKGDCLGMRTVIVATDSDEINRMANAGLILLYDWREPDTIINAIAGGIPYSEWLQMRASEMISHGRIARIRKQPSTGMICMWVDNVSWTKAEIERTN